MMQGQVYCLRDAILEVDLAFRIRYSGSLLRVRPYSFRYIAWIRGGKNVLKYHNVHAGDDDYHHRVYNPLTGKEEGYETLERHNFPVMAEVLDEMELITRVLNG